MANWVFTRLPMIPCKPILALAKARAAYPSALVHVAWGVLKLDCLALNKRIAEAIVNKACKNVPKNSQIRDFEPILSPMRPKKAPPKNDRIDVSDCRSIIRKLGPGTSEIANRRARASESCDINVDGSF